MPIELDPVVTEGTTRRTRAARPELDGPRRMPTNSEDGDCECCGGGSGVCECPICDDYLGTVGVETAFTGLTLYPGGHATRGGPYTLTAPTLTTWLTDVAVPQKYVQTSHQVFTNTLNPSEKLYVQVLLEGQMRPLIDCNSNEVQVPTLVTLRIIGYRNTVGGDFFEISTAIVDTTLDDCGGDEPETPVDFLISTDDLSATGSYTFVPGSDNEFTPRCGTGPITPLCASCCGAANDWFCSPDEMPAALYATKTAGASCPPYDPLGSTFGLTLVHYTVNGTFFNYSGVPGEWLLACNGDVYGWDVHDDLAGFAPELMAFLPREFKKVGEVTATASCNPVSFTITFDEGYLACGSDASPAVFTVTE